MIAFRPANDAAVAQGQASGAGSGGGRAAAAAAAQAAGGARAGGGWSRAQPGGVSGSGANMPLAGRLAHTLVAPVASRRRWLASRRRWCRGGGSGGCAGWARRRWRRGHGAVAVRPAVQAEGRPLGRRLWLPRVVEYQLEGPVGRAGHLRGPALAPALHARARTRQREPTAARYSARIWQPAQWRGLRRCGAENGSPAGYSGQRQDASTSGSVSGGQRASAASGRPSGSLAARLHQRVAARAVGLQAADRPKPMLRRSG